MKNFKRFSALLSFSLCFFSPVKGFCQTEIDTVPAATPITWVAGISVPATEYAQQQIQKYIDQYTKPFGKQQLIDVLEGGETYRLYVRSQLKAKNMPAVLEYLPVVESDYNPKAVSRSGAKGLWQFMDNSIEGLLKKTDWIDERYDPWKSTDAALKKLMENYNQFKDWPIALAAYNCGAGAMKKILKQAKEKSFWYIAETGLLRDQSVNYVPKLLAICWLCQHGSLYDIDFPPESTTSRYAEFDYITTKEQVNLDRLASELKMDLDYLTFYNPALLKGCTPPSAIYSLRLPEGMKEAALYAIDSINGKTIPSGQKMAVIHTVQPGETLWSISRTYGVSVEQIKKLNKISDTDILAAGKILYIKQKNAEN